MIRRLGLIAGLVAGLLLAGCGHCKLPAAESKLQHVVLCWLKSPGDQAARQKIIELSKSFASIPGVISVKAGVAVPSERAIVDDSFDVGIIFAFADRESMQTYLEHPTHKNAVKDAIAPLTSKIVVYDIIE